MWTDSEDARRYEELTLALMTVTARHTPAGEQEPVTPGDLALYLEWLELAREAAPTIRPFIDKSSPFALRALSYGQLARDFQLLRASH
jgi:hypothetical protein